MSWLPEVVCCALIVAGVAGYDWRPAAIVAGLAGLFLLWLGAEGGGDE